VHILSVVLHSWKWSTRVSKEEKENEENISACCLADIGPLNQLKKLTCMSLPEAQLTSQDLTRLSGLTDMTSLDVRGSHLTAPFAIRSALRPFQNLRHLDVSGSR